MQEDPDGLLHLHGIVGLHLPQAVFQAGLRISHGVQVNLQGLDGVSVLRKSSQELLPQNVQSDHCGALLDLLGPVLVWLLLVLLSQLIVQGPVSAIDVLRFEGIQFYGNPSSSSWFFFMKSSSA